MSLGPPFDDSESGVRLQLQVGAATVVTLVLAVFLALLATARTLGETLTLRIRVLSPGALHPGAAVHLGGEAIGEVVAIRDRRLARRGSSGEGGAAEATVEIEARVARAWQHALHQNSAYFAWSPNVLTEAVLEVGPPPGGAAPGKVVQDGEVLRGQDPPEIGLLLTHLHHSLVAAKGVADELRPDWEDLRGALRQLDLTGAQVVADGQLARIGTQGGQALDAARHLRRALGESAAPERTLALSRELSRSAERLSPELVAAGLQLAMAEAQVQALGQDLHAARRQQLSDTVVLLRRLFDLYERLNVDVLSMVRYVESGRGTLGGFNQDLQIFDELKELHRLMKRESWRVLIKTPDRGQRQVR